jgi:hypothetical protein
MTESIQSILNRFTPISLKEMDSVKLMTRSDEKYLCRIDQLPALLHTAIPDFRILENYGKRLLGYESQYLDTPDFQMYLQHHNGKLNRYKIRIREYQESHEFFIEIKYKDNHRNTTKKRIPIGPDRNYHTAEVRQFLEQNSRYLPENLEPKLFSQFRRMTLVNNELMERITIDLNPTWYTKTKKVDLQNIVIMEVKSAKSSNIRGFGLLLRDARILPSRLSKYCTGTILLNPGIKHNRFKAKMVHLKKLDKNIPYGEPAIFPV